MEKITSDQIKPEGLIFEVITGSRAYGLDTSTSDTDIRGVFILPKERFYALEQVGQISNDTSDIVYYELKRFMGLLAKNNPNILELLNIPESKILFKDEIMHQLRPELFLSRLCEHSFANYAFTQIKKAWGLEKKILNPVDEQRKSVLDFCFVYESKEATPMKKYLSSKRLDHSRMGLSVIDHMKDCYNLFYSDKFSYPGIMRNDTSNDVSLSTIPKGEESIGILYFNRDEYSRYCKKYKEYWEWVSKRNEDRYQNTLSHGKNYDAKNMMHVFRLLLMAKEIAIENKINVWRKDREFLLDIKKGKFGYDELVQRAEALKSELPILYEKSNLPDAPDLNMINGLLYQMREEYYKRK